nr:hypothetical protein [Vibrio parahaemolyticus]
MIKVVYGGFCIALLTP